LIMLCFDTFRGFSHKIYAATMDGKGEEGTYNFFSRRLGGAAGRQGIGHRGQVPPLVTMSIKTSTNGATTQSRINSSEYAGQATIFS